MTCSLLCKILLVVCFVGLVKSAAIPENTSATTSPPHWNYHDVRHWKEHFSLCGDEGGHQSPINLDSTKAKVMNYTAFNFTNYDKIFPEMVTNNGHTVMMKLGVDGDQLPFITGGGLTDRYNFFQLHFHWGANPLKGSEHHINHRQYPAELHLVHYNAKYGSLTEAVPHPDGLAVLGIMIELEARDNPVFRHIEQFNGIVEPDATKFNNLSYSVPLADLLPDDTGSFYRYQGSLTTPGCNEDVIWTIFDTPIAISKRQLDIFRQLHDDEGQAMENNFRPIQELHNRIVTYRQSDSNSTVDLDDDDDEVVPYITIEIVSL